MTKKRTIVSVLAGMLFMAAACKSDYSRMMEEGLASGIRADSLFLGVRIGMTNKEFFAHCWELNKQQLIMQGNANTSVQYDMTELKQPAIMNFYPTFHEGRIHEMPVTFHYKAWAPWNKELWADSLVQDVKTMMETWYGGKPFVRFEHPEKGYRYVKVDGNRRIILWPEDDQYVKALYTDLTMEEAMDAHKQAVRQEASAPAGPSGE
jgi:hypothetical protein